VGRCTRYGERVSPINSRQGLAADFSSPIPEGASLAERAYLALRDKIVSLEIQPGQLIREEQVMEDLGASRTPIREALLRLSQQQLVVVIPRRGTFATDVHVGEVGIVYELRRELESVAARWAAERRDEADTAELQALIDELRELDPSPGPDLQTQLALDRQAHGLIHRLAGNPLMQSALSTYHLLAERIWFLAAARISWARGFHFDDVIELLEAIRDGDPERAAELARGHLESAEQALRAAL
jgi:DNA-binding GntR family transcriptional regulator